VGGLEILSKGAREGVEKVADRLRKATKVASKLLRPFFGLDIQKSNCF